MSTIESILAILIVLFPLAGFLFLGIFGSRIKNEKIIGISGSATIAVSFVSAIIIFIDMLGRSVSDRIITVTLFQWISAFTLSSFDVSIAYLFDPLSIVMILVVTGVGLLIHIYSIGYMHGDKGYWRYFAYLNLFIFAMLNLVLADNFLLMFLGWEGVGLCSYLLIGFWYEKSFTGDAAKKAFIVNRIGDFGFILGMLFIFTLFGSLNFSTVFNAASLLPVGHETVFWICLLLFVGATGKSAQIPLYVWLPDAMAGPTPVSALIHAATMVTAGVYMIARCAILYALAPLALQIVAIVGMVTAIFAATIGLVQNDIKKVLAYSTISQLGYMFAAMGVAAFDAGIFHVMTHAFFKALLFLGSGAVIHAMHEEQNIQNMGGLKKYLPVTYFTFVVGTLAIAGIPPFAGFFSKDEILWNVISSDHGSVILWLLGMLGSALTALYMARLLILTFEGSPRFNTTKLHPHEAPRTMTIPLVVLAVLSTVGGFVGIPHASLINSWLAPVFEPARLKLLSVENGSFALELGLMALSVAIALIAILAAKKYFLLKPELAESVIKKYTRIHTLLLNKYYVDELYEKLIVRPLLVFSEKLLWKQTDVRWIDGAVNGTVALIRIIADRFRKVQTGVVQFYAVIFVAGLLFLLTWIVFR